MYICPICKKEFNTSERVAKHSLACWREQHPNFQSNPAPRSKNITTRKVNNEVLNFFDSFVSGDLNGRETS